MFATQSIKRIILSIILISIATPAHGWWFSDWLFGKPEAKTEVKASTAGNHVLLAAVGTLALSSCFWGWRLYTKIQEAKEDRERAERQHAKTLEDIHKQNAQYGSRMLQMGERLSKLAELQNSYEKENSQQKDKYAAELKKKEEQIQRMKRNAAVRIMKLRARHAKKEAFNRIEENSGILARKSQSWFNSHATSPRN